MSDVIEKLKRLPGANFAEVCEKQTFECYRILEDGCMQAVTVVVFDAGPNLGATPRYSGYATSAEGRTVVANAESSLDAMLSSFRWSELDPDPDPAKDALAQGVCVKTQGDSSPEMPPDPSAAEAEFDRRSLFAMLKRRTKPPT